MNYLDSSKLPEILEKYFSKDRECRLFGQNLQYDTGYYDIVRFHGAGAVDPADVEVNYVSELFALTDPLIAEFAIEIERRMRNDGRLYDGPPATKLVDYNLKIVSPYMTVQPCNYGLQAATCFALDLPHKSFERYGGTLRDYYLEKRATLNVQTNPLAVCLGVCAYLIIEEEEHQYLLQVKRSSNLASLEGSFGPTVAGSVDFVEDYTTLEELINQSLSDEVCEELNLETSEFEIIPLAWAMEVFRGERPQLFCLLKTTLNRAILSRRLDAINQASREFESYGFITLAEDHSISEDQFNSLNTEARMNWLLMRECLVSTHNADQ